MRKNLKSILKKIAKEFNLDLLIVFGSYSKNKSNKKSDLDLAYISKTEIDEKELIYQIVKQTKINNIDLVKLNERTSIELKWEIFRNGVCIHQKHESIFAEKLCNAFMDYVDFKDKIEIKYKILNEKLESINTDKYKKTIEI